MAETVGVKAGLIIYLALYLFSIGSTENTTCACEEGYKCFGATPTCLAQEEVCDGQVQCPYGDDEFFCSVDYLNPCRGEPRICPAHPSSCVDPPNICDGFPDCPTGEDEVACNTTSCPLDCECHYLSVRCKKVLWNEDQSSKIQADTRKLWIQKSTDQVMNETEGLDLSSAVHVNFSRLNNVNILTIRSFPFTVITPGIFDPLRFVVFIDLTANKISRLQADTFGKLPTLKEIYMLQNGLQVIETGAFRGLDSLLTLNLMLNDLTRLSSGMFEGLKNLKFLVFNKNAIEIIEPLAFIHLEALTYLDLEYNEVSSLPKGVFNGLSNLDSLHLGYNKIASIRNSTFIDLMNLTYLDLNGNPLVLIEAHAYKGLSRLEVLIISETQLANVDEGAAFGTNALQELTADDPKLCCLFKPSLECNTPPNPFATCEGLLRNTLLRTCIWLIGISALVGNVLVIAWRTYKRKLDRENSVQMSFITNLAVADLLMGIYMVFIGSADAYFGVDYFLHSEAWRNSFACKMAGFVAMVSSEASVFLLLLISLDRFICICFPFGVFRFRTRSSRIALFLAWLFAILLATIPVIVNNRINGFYGYSDVCIGLPLVTPATGFQGVWEDVGDTEVYHFVSTGNSGWAYSTAVFIVLNLICFLAIFVFYIAIFVYVRKAAASSGRKTERRAEIRMAMKMAVIVGTDFLCWMPVIVMGILSQSGSATIPVVTYVWAIAFVLPINSSLNPYLYTISTIIQKADRSRKPSTSGSHRFSTSSQRTSLSGGKSQAPEGVKLTTQQ